MKTLLFWSVIITVWATLSSINYNVLTNVYKCEFNEDPRVFLGILFAPAVILIIVGCGLGRLMSKRVQEGIQYLNKKGD